MKDLLKKLNKKEDVLGTFYFKGAENLFAFSEEYTVSESRIKRIALVLTQTMDALGGISFDRFLLEGKDKRIAIYKKDGGYCGIVFKNNVPFSSIETIYKSLISEAVPVGKKVVEREKVIKEKEVKREKPITKVLEKPEEIVSSTVFDKIKVILAEYLGDFSETIFENQMSDIAIKPESATISKVKKLCFSLQKASSMIIGPTQSRLMVDKLLSVVKSGQATGS